MTFTTLYRSLAAALVSAAVLAAATGCETQGAHKTLKEEQYAKWNAARIGVLYQLAKQQYEVGDFDKCRDTLKQAFAHNAPHAGVHILAAKVDLEKGTLEPASEHLKQAMVISPAEPEAYYLMGVVYQRWQNLERAAEFYQKAWERKATDPLYLLAVVETMIARGMTGDAEALLQEKLEYFEQSAAIRAALGKLALLRGDADAAAAYLQQATLLSPEDHALKLNYAEALTIAGKHAAALPVLESLSKDERINDKTMILSLLGHTYMNLHRPRDARTCFAQITREVPHDNLAWLNLGKATMQLEDYPQVVSVARRVLKADAKNVQALLLMAVAQDKLKQTAEAAATLAQARALAPNHPTVLCLLGLQAQAKGEAEAAAAFFRQAAESAPDDPWARELAGVTDNATSSDR